MKKLLILLAATILTSCSNENSLEGKTFLLSNPELKQPASKTLLQFTSNSEVEIFTIKDMFKSINSYTKSSYRLEGNIFSIQGASYKMKSNKDGYNLYKGETLKYKLLAWKEDLAGSLLADSILKKEK